MNELEFRSNVESMFREFLEHEPVAATFMGIHDNDHRLPECSLTAIEAKHAALKKHLVDLQSVNKNTFSKDGQIDYTLVTQVLKNVIMDHERIEAHLRNPGYYLDPVMGGIFSLLLKDFAPLEERLRSIIGRIEETPRVLNEAQTNLQPERIPKVWAEVTLEQARMGPGLFEWLLPATAADFPDLKEQIVALGQIASAAVTEFANYLEQKVIPAAAGNFAVGTEIFNTLLKEMHMVDYNDQELLDTGWRLFEETREQMKEVAREIDPELTVEQALEKIKDDHSTAESLLDDYRQAMEKSRDFVIQQKIATIPDGEVLSIVETPSFLRPLIPYAAYIGPGIFEESLEGIFLVTPPDPNATPDEQKEKLRGKPKASLPVTALHEGYPGHHLQLVWSASRGTTARKMGIMLSTLFIEGWAFYCEELMEQLGFINTPEQKLGRLNDQLWRAARIIIDVSLHCRDMSIEEAVEFLTEKCRLQRADALAEVRRYTTSPTQPQSYLMGKLEILKIIDEYKNNYPEDTMLKMHDTILACGSLTPKLMCKQLF